ncbi:MAG: redoxin domain-containing protein [Alphaproteobacteria bacterium]|nr:redoxin domain-containing protein [Alphaproteobacteria bacterium]MCB9793614.1 redoxin domain-containing protein [Alphaproteobacteria bacterium]
MAERLGARGVRVFALSRDSVDEVAAHQARDSFAHITLLADPELEVIRAYGVEHHKALGMQTTRYSLLGMPLSFRVSFSAMAIPTSLLVDEHGVIRWIDQSEDYRLRSDDALVLGAVEACFGG